MKGPSLKFKNLVLTKHSQTSPVTKWDKNDTANHSMTLFSYFSVYLPKCCKTKWNRWSERTPKSQVFNKFKMVLWVCICWYTETNVMRLLYINSLTQQDPWKYPILTVQWPAGAQNYTQHSGNFSSEGNNEMNRPPVSTWSHYFSFLRSLSKTALLLLNSNLQVTKLIFSFSLWPHFSFSQKTFYFYPSFPRETPVQE